MPASLETALGARLTAGSARGCFSCDSPATVTVGTFDIASRTPGIGCEAWHGPGSKDIASRRAHKPREAAIFNLAHLDKLAQSKFCNKCHVSAAHVKLRKTAVHAQCDFIRLSAPGMPPL